MSGIWRRQDPSTGFPTSAKSPMPHMGPQRSRDLLHWKQSLTEALSYLGVQITNVWTVPVLSDALATVHLDRTQGGQRNPKNICAYISHQSGLMGEVGTEREYFPEAKIKLKCRE